MTDFLQRIAGAPISWGVCEVPGWGYQLQPDLVLSQMQSLGLAATEFGPVGFLPAAPADKVEMLDSFGLAAVGEFVPVVLHDASADPTATLDEALDGLVAAGASVVVLAAATGLDGYDKRPALDASEWRLVAATLDMLSDRAADRGLTACLHPHVGTVVETAEEIDRVLNTSQVALCLDTGHALIGGADPVAIAKEATSRIRHMHLKDVDLSWAERVRAGELSYSAAVAEGLYRPLGQGEVDIADIVTTLEAADYDGWYVLEQDTILQSEPSPDAGPIDDVRSSLDYLRAVSGAR